MRDGILFELTKDHLESGLREVPVGYCVTSHVDSKKGLFYAGRPIGGLLSKTPEEIIYLLYHGELGTPEELGRFSQEISRRSTCTDQVVNQIASLPKTNQPMDAFAAAVLIAGMIEGNGDYREDCLDIIGKIPHIAACVIRSQRGLESVFPSKKNGYIERLSEMINGENLFLPTLSLFFILNIDYGGGDLSAFVGKTVSSGLENMYGCIASSLLSLGGKRQATAIQEGFDVVYEVAKRGNTKEIFEEILEREALAGFSHSPLKIEDPRVSIYYEHCQKYFSENPLVHSALMLREEGLRMKNLSPNFEAIVGVMLHAAGIELQFAPLLVGTARGIGTSIQIIYERLLAKEGKGTPIMNPSYLYKHRV